MEKPNYYSIIPANVRYDTDLMANSKLLYGEITALCNDKGFCWAGNEYFAELYNVSKETISRWISQLYKKGYINTKIFYKKDSKEIDKRIISINQYPIDENINTPYQKNQSNNLLTKTSIPYCQNNQYPIDKNVKENITSINNKEKEEGIVKIIDFYENNITLITDFVKQEIESFIDDGISDDLIIEAMKEAVSRNKRNWKYVKSILNNCYNNNIKTVQQYRISQENFKSNKNKTIPNVKTEEKIEYDEIEYNEEEYKKKILEKG